MFSSKHLRALYSPALFSVPDINLEIIGSLDDLEPNRRITILGLTTLTVTLLICVYSGVKQKGFIGVQQCSFVNKNDDSALSTFSKKFSFSV